jgi:hypothetical protein
LRDGAAGRLRATRRLFHAAVASDLLIEPQTLSRRLKDQGASFRDLRNRAPP